MSDKKKKGTYNLIGAIFLGIYGAYIGLMFIGTGQGMALFALPFMFAGLILGGLVGSFIGGYFYDNFIKNNK